jgi:hypothetical protein
MKDVEDFHQGSAHRKAFVFVCANGEERSAALDDVRKSGADETPSRNGANSVGEGGTDAVEDVLDDNAFEGLEMEEGLDGRVLV